MSFWERRRPRREVVLAVATAAAGAAAAGIPTEVINLRIEQEEDKEKIVGGNWSRHEITADGILHLEFIPNAEPIARLQGTTFTINPDSAPDLEVDLSNPHQLPVEDGGWKVLKIVSPDKNGKCSFAIPVAMLGKPTNGFYEVSADVYGWDLRVGQQTTASVNYAPNGTVKLPPKVALSPLRFLRMPSRAK